MGSYLSGVIDGRDEEDDHSAHYTINQNTNPTPSAAAAGGASASGIATSNNSSISRPLAGRRRVSIVPMHLARNERCLQSLIRAVVKRRGYVDQCWQSFEEGVPDKRRALPKEVLPQIFEYADFTKYISVYSNRTHQVTDGERIYLQCPIPPHSQLHGHRLVSASITTFSHDQGWSSDPVGQGTFDGSWTWGSISLRSNETNTTLVELETHRNKHAVRDWQSYTKHFTSDDELIKAANRTTSNATLVYKMHAKYPGWIHHCGSASITIRFVREV